MQTHSRNRQWPGFGLTVIDLKRWLIYKPLAILLAILMAPAVSWIESGPRSRAPRPFQAHASQAPLCTPGQNCIITNYLTTYAADLLQLEQDSVNSHLALHSLQPSDAPVVYQYGRQDLRDEVRAAMFANMLGIIQKPASARSAHEQNLYNWFQNLVQTNEISLYTQAIQQYQEFLGNPCTFKLDNAVAAAYKISFDGTPWCFGGLPSSIFAPPVPAASYFTAYGLAHSYAANAYTDPNYASVFADSAVNVGEIWGIGLGAAAVVSASVAPVIAVNLSAALAALADVTSGTGIVSLASTAGENVPFLIAGSAVASNGIVFSVAGPVGIIFAAVTIGVVAGLELYDNQKQIDELNGLSAILTQVTNTPPDLASLANDPTGLGMYKLENSFFSQTDPDTPSTATLPTHQLTDPSFAITPAGGSTQYSETLDYRDWNGNFNTTQTWGGWFIGACVAGPQTTAPCQQVSSVNSSMRFVDWTGLPWIASREGLKFVVTNPSASPTDTLCAADPVTGVTISSHLNLCVSYVTNVLDMIDFSGNPIQVSLTNFQAPSFVSPGPLTFSLGTATTQSISAAGNPTPTICLTGAAPANFTVASGGCASGVFPLTFSGSLSAPTGTASMQLTATNSQGSSSQTFTVTVANQLNIVSSSTLSGTAGAPFSFTVVATGVPTPALSLNSSGYNLQGLSFQDNGNGTATLSGEYAGILSSQTCSIGGCGGFVATNSQGSVTQNFTLNMAGSPVAVLGPPSIANFIAGVYNAVMLTSYGAATPVSWVFDADPNAPWLTLVDNGNGTAVLSGKPPTSVNGTFQPFLAPNALGSGVPFVSQFPVTVTNTPVFTSPSTATFTVGTEGSFLPTANTGSITTSGTLPSGLTAVFGNPANIVGNPAIGTGGQYQIKLLDSATSGSAVQGLTVDINEAPAITSPNLVVLFAGQPYSFDVTATGFPSVSNHQVSFGSTPPTSPSQGLGMNFRLSPTLNGMQATNINNLGLATGTLTTSGTARSQDVGTHSLTIAAENGVGTKAVQTLTVEIYPYSPAASINLISSFMLSRDANHDVVATVVVANNGTGTAQNVGFTSAKIGSVTGIVSPAAIASVGPASTATFTIVFPAGSMGLPGTPGVLILSGAYTGGTFSSGGRLVLP
jgi:hypothetical protein